MNVIYHLSIGILLLFSALTNAQERPLLEQAKESFSPLPKSVINQHKQAALIHLGEKLYFEKKLSMNDKISCNSCHKLDQFGVDNEPTSPGHDGTRGERNSPTVYNAALNFVQFWDGRAADLAEQAIGPILNPIEHGLPNEEAAIAKISTEEYQELFKKGFVGQASPLTYKNIGVAIEAFEKTLLTPSRFDDYLEGTEYVLTNTEKRGLKKFIQVGCVSCHNGPGIGGNSYQLIGAVNEYETKDLGRFNVTKKPEDQKFFKVPSLRNVVHTGPYFHDGKISTIEEAVRLMGHHQLGVELSENDISEIVSFLGTLTGKKGTFYKVAAHHDNQHH